MFLNQFSWNSLCVLRVHYTVPPFQWDFENMTGLPWLSVTLRLAPLSIIHLDFPWIDLDEPSTNNRACAMVMAAQLGGRREGVEVILHGKAETPECALRLEEAAQEAALVRVTRGRRQPWWYGDNYHPPKAKMSSPRAQHLSG
jgi:hypothetical protein